MIIFCEKSGQSVSESKSKVYFSPNIDIASRENMCNILGFRSTASLESTWEFQLSTLGHPIMITILCWIE